MSSWASRKEGAKCLTFRSSGTFFRRAASRRPLTFNVRSMRLLSKIAFALLGLLFTVLAVHSHFPEALPLNGDREVALLFVSGALATMGFLCSKGDPLPYLINQIWCLVCAFSVIAIIDFSLRLGHIKGGLFSLWPLHVFTVYGGWVIATNEVIEQEHVRRLWVVGVVAFFLSPMFNYG